MYNLFNGSVEELIDVVSTLPVDDYCQQMAQEYDLNKMFDKMRNGCPKLTEQYKCLPCPPIDIVSPTYQLENEGLFVDVATYLNGQPECWIAESYQSNNKPAKDFYINISIPEKISNETKFQKLIQMVQIIDSLEGNGQRLNVYLVYYTMGAKGAKKAEFICKVKDQSEPVNIHQMVYLIASAAVQRYCAFNLRFNKINKQAIYNYADMDDIQLQNEDIFYCPSYAFDKQNYLTDYANTDLRTAYKII